MAADTDIALDSLRWEICPDFGNDCQSAGISSADIYLNGAAWGKYWACWPPAGAGGAKLLLSLYNPVLQRPDTAILFQCVAGSGICLPLKARGRAIRGATAPFLPPKRRNTKNTASPNGSPNT